MEEIRMAITLKAEKRDNLALSATKEVRNRGFIPAVVYGQGKEATTVAVESIALLKTVRDEGRNAIISLDLEGDTVDVMVHEYQTDPVRGDVTHIDFYTVDMTETMDVEVSLRLEGDAIGVKDGGILQQPLYELEIRALPRDIPEEIVLNVEELQIGDSLSIEDLPKSDKYEYLEDLETAVAVVLPPEEEEEESTEEVDLSVEPELVGAADDEDEDEEEAE